MSDLRVLEETAELDVDATVLNGEIFLKFDPLISNNCTLPFPFPFLFFDYSIIILF